MNSIADSVTTALHLILDLDPALLAIVLRSLAVSATASVIACAIGLCLGAWLGVARFPLRGAVLTLLNTSLALPSVVVGLVLYLLLSRSGPLGFLGWLFSFKAMVLAQAVLVLPVVTALTRQAVEDIERAHGEQLRALGARPLLRSLLLAWNERFALLTIVITAFGRAISEVGAVMVVGGNIDGFTRVMTTAIALETSKGDLPLALALGLVLLTVVLALNMLLGLLRHWRARRDAARAADSRPSSPSTHVATALPDSSHAHDRVLPAGTPLFTLRDATVRYDAVVALDRVTLDIAAGERVALVGANGSGKSTLLRLLQDLLPPAQGTITRHDGLRQAMLFQHPFLLRSSLRHNIALGLWLAGFGWTAARRAAPNALQRVELGHLRDRNAHALSGGQQQRAALALAWARDPDVLLLDEPTASLDPHAKREVEALMEAFAAPRGERAMTLVFSSHNLGQVKRLASRVIYLEHGRILADLPADRFFNGPLPEEAHLFVKGERI
jgi:tungstate transport system ATP-binding protein